MLVVVVVVVVVFVVGVGGMAELFKSAAPLSVPRRVKPICFIYCIKCCYNMLKGGPAIPPTLKLVRPVGAMLALYSLLGASWASSAFLAAFFLACWCFLRLVGRSGIDFEGRGGSKTSVW